MWGYPTFLAAFPSEFWAFEAQLFLYLVAAWFLARVLRPYSEAGVDAVFLGCCLNVFVLVYAPETLTEVPTLIVILAMAAIWVAGLCRADSWWVTVAGGLLAGVAITFRPASVFLPAVWLAGRMAQVKRLRPVHTAVAILAAALPLVPQVRENWIHARQLTPLPIKGQPWGLGTRVLRHGAMLKPAGPVSVMYQSPWTWSRPNNRDWSEWLNLNPAVSAATLVLHEFTLIDEDEIFPYPLTWNPPYRIPFQLFNNVMVALGFIGLARLWRRKEPAIRAARLPIAIYLAGFALVYAFLRTEVRYGFPVLLLLYPLAVMTVGQGRVRWVWVGAYTVAALALSEWVRSTVPPM